MCTHEWRCGYENRVCSVGRIRSRLPGLESQLSLLVNSATLDKLFNLCVSPFPYLRGEAVEAPFCRWDVLSVTLQ